MKKTRKEWLAELKAEYLKNKAAGNLEPGTTFENYRAEVAARRLYDRFLKGNRK